MAITYKVRYLRDLDSRFIDNVIEPGEAELVERPDWFARLEDHILREGVRNPVVLTARTTAQELSLEPRYGGSRIWVAQRNGLRVPAVIADFDDCFPESPRILPLDIAIAALFPDRPHKVFLKDYGINVSGCPDIHI